MSLVHGTTGSTPKSPTVGGNLRMGGMECSFGRLQKQVAERTQNDRQYQPTRKTPRTTIKTQITQ